MTLKVVFSFQYPVAALSQIAFVDGMRTVVAMAHTKAASSRAIATVTMLIERPLACMRR